MSRDKEKRLKRPTSFYAPKRNAAAPEYNVAEVDFITFFILSPVRFRLTINPTNYDNFDESLVTFLGGQAGIRMNFEFL